MLSNKIQKKIDKLSRLLYKVHELEQNTVAVKIKCLSCSVKLEPINYKISELLDAQNSGDLFYLVEHVFCKECEPQQDEDLDIDLTDYDDYDPRTLESECSEYDESNNEQRCRCS